MASVSRRSDPFFWEKAPLFRLLLPFLAGIIIYDGCREKDLLLKPFCLLFGVCFLLLLRVSAVRKDTPKIRVWNMAMVVFLLTAAYLSCYLTDIRNHPLSMERHWGEAGKFAVRVTDRPEAKARTWKVKVKVLYAMYADRTVRLKGEAILYLYKQDGDSLSIGQGSLLLVPDQWQYPEPPPYPHAFDYSKYAKRNGISGILFTSPASIICIPESRPYELPLFRRLQGYSMEKLSLYLKDTATLGLMQAMLLGEEGYFDPAHRQAYTNTGIIHIVAISGGHVAFLFSMISGCFFWLKRRRRSYIPYMISLPFIWLYVGMAGAPPSAVRAAGMFTLLAGGYLIQRDNQQLNHLFGAALILLFIYPNWIFSAGFLLSFTAVLSLILYYRPMICLWNPASLLLRKLWAVMVLSLAAEILIAPVVIYLFHHFPVLFLPANILAWLIMGLVMAGGFLLLLLSWLPAVAHGIAYCIGGIVELFHSLLFILQQYDPECFGRLYLSGISLTGTYAFILGASIWALQKNPRGMSLLLTGILLVCASSCCTAWKGLHQDRLILYPAKAGLQAVHLRKGTAVFYTSDSTRCLRTLRTEHKELLIHNQITHIRLLEMKGQVLSAGNKRLFFLNQPYFIPPGADFPVDVLVLSSQQSRVTGATFRHYSETFHCRLIVLGRKYPQKEVDIFRDSCRQYGIVLHDLFRDGPYRTGR